MNKLSQDQKISFLHSLSFFSKFDLSIITTIASLLNEIHIKRGEILIKQNDVSYSMYFVFGGHFKAIVREEDGIETVVGEIGQGGIIGEIALIIAEPRTATIQAIRDSILLEFSRENFDVFTKEHPDVAMSIARFCVKRLSAKKSNHRVNIKTLAFIPAGKNELFSEFVAKYANALNNVSPTLHLNKKKCDELYNKNDPEQLTHFLHEQENKYAYVIYETDHFLNDWTRLCLQHSDELMFVGLYGSSPALNPIEEEIFKQNDQVYLFKQLILLHKTTNQPRETQAWLSLRKINDHHHVRVDFPKDYAKLIRFFTGTATGLVFGGGGMRGVAHISLIRALEELQIEFDVIGGTSIGAAAGGYYAQGYTSEEMIKTKDMLLKKYRHSLKYNLPFLSLMTGKVFWNHLQNDFKDIQIENLWKKYFCVSTNLSQNKLVVFTKGPLWQCIGTSSSIPGIFPPVVDEHGYLYVDGGLLNNLPVDIMRKYIGTGLVIGVDINPNINTRYAPIKIAASGWDWLLQKFINKNQKMPTMTDTIFLSMTLAGRKNKKEVYKYADHLIHFDVSGYKLLQTRGLEELMHACYLSALQQLKKIFR